MILRMSLRCRKILFRPPLGGPLMPSNCEMNWLSAMRKKGALTSTDLGRGLEIVRKTRDQTLVGEPENAVKIESTVLLFRPCNRVL